MQESEQAAKPEHVTKEGIHARIRNVGKEALFKTTFFAVVFLAITLLARFFVYPQLSEQAIFYLQLAVVGVIGYLGIRVVSEVVTKLVNGEHHQTQARSAISIIRIGGLLIVLAIVVIMLARDPYVTLAVTTIAGIALAVSIQSVIGNAIAGMVLAIVRPFKIGDTVTVFGITGSVRDIGLLYVRMSTIEGKKTVLVPNGTMIATAIVKERIQS